MAGLSPRNRWLLGSAIAAAAVFFAHLLDGTFYTHFVDRKTADPFSRISDWRMALRVTGYLPLWWFVTLMLWFTHTPENRPCRRRLLALAWLPAVAVLLVEVLKMTVRRRRPIDAEGGYEFIPWTGEITSSGMGFPSSHAAVAFTGAFILWHLYPRGRFFWLALGVGCALSRVSYRHHFFSDVTMSAVVALAVVTLLLPRVRS